MKYVITNKIDGNFIIAGPLEWKSNYFSSVVSDEAGYPVRITKEDEMKVPFEPVPGIIIRRCKVVHEEIDTDIQQHVGPVIEYKDDEDLPYGYALATYKAENKNLRLLKDEIKNKISAERWKLQNTMIQIKLGELDYYVSTKKETRDILIQKYVLMAEDSKVNWKFFNDWAELSKQDVLNIVSSIDEHVQKQFDWENNIVSRINSIENHLELKTILLENIQQTNNNRNR